MELFKAIYGRRSIRRFIDKDVKPEDIKKIISAATYAPSACNIQGWKFIIIKDKGIKEKLVGKGTIKFIEYAPVGILVLYDNRSENPEYSDYIQSASAAIQNMILAAYSMGIGSCWVCHLPLKGVLRKLFGIPPDYDPIAYIAMGYYEAEPKVHPRKHSFNQIASFNRFEFKEKKDFKTTIYRFIKRTAFRIYKFVPFKKYLHSITKNFEKFN